MLRRIRFYVSLAAIALMVVACTPGSGSVPVSGNATTTTAPAAASTTAPTMGATGTAAGAAGNTTPTTAATSNAAGGATATGAATAASSGATAASSGATATVSSGATTTATSQATSGATSAPTATQAAAASGSGSANTNPIKIGISLSLSGDFSADGQAFQRGYQLWADVVNKNGGLLGRQVQLDIVSDASSTDQVQTNYQKLITQDKVDLVFGPYSTLLTKPASVVANRYGYALPEGAGGGPSVFTQGLKNVFDVSLPVANNLDSFSQYILSLPSDQRPTSIAYATQDDPFTQPQVDRVKQLFEKAGIQTASYQVYPSETTDFAPIADKIIASKAQVVVVGTMLPDIAAFIQRFRQQKFNPKALIATAGPDLGADFIKAIGGVQYTEGIMVPNGWYPSANNAGNKDMVDAYIAKFGGKPEDISADVAEAYSVGQVMQQVVTKLQSLDNAKIIAEMHSGSTYDSVQGPVKFDPTGQNTAAQAYLFQWQKGALVPVYPANATGAVKAEMPKPVWQP